jgi:hypothetical protein
VRCSGSERGTQAGIVPRLPTQSRWRSRALSATTPHGARRAGPGNGRKAFHCNRLPSQQTFHRNRLSIHTHPFGNETAGGAAVREPLGALFSALQDFSFRPSKFYQAADAVIVEGAIHGTQGTVGRYPCER